MKLILDNFYDDPDRLRELALSLEFSSRAKNLPAQRSTRSVIPEEASKAFRSILQLDLGGAENRIPYNGCFQLMRAEDSKRSYVHADQAATWAALVYLSEKTEPRGGTSFFRHKATGLSRLPDSSSLKQGELEKLKAMFRADRAKPAKWTELDRVGFVYNRFVLYDAQLFHRNGKTWGSSVRNGRLTHNFFI